MTSWHSYPKIYALGHRAITDLLLDDVIVQEKLDGSQFSFGRFPRQDTVCEHLWHHDIMVRSKGATMHVDAPEKMFTKAVDTVKLLASELVPGWTYRAEYLAKPKHNTLAYDRVPDGYLALFDINTGEEEYATYEVVEREAKRLGLGVVPLIHRGRIEDIAGFRVMLDRESFLGGQKIEGVVVKNYKRFGVDKKVLMGKFVSEAFKEAHMGEWRDSNPTSNDIVQQCIEGVRTPARWAKAVQHLRERGVLTDSPRDIGTLIKEAQNDIVAECGDEIKDRILKWAMPHILRGAIKGLPEWYKEELLKKQFDDGDPALWPLQGPTTEVSTLAAA